MSEIIQTLPPFLLNAKQVAERLGISKPKAYSIMRRREIPVVVFGRSVRVKPGDLEAFIEDNTERGHDGKTPW